MSPGSLSVWVTGSWVTASEPLPALLGTIAHLSLQLRHTSTIGKKLVKQQYLFHMSYYYGEFRTTNGWDRFPVLGTPANFSRFWVLAASLHGALVVGVSQTLRRWTDGATYIMQGGHYFGHWPTFLVMVALCNRAGHYIFALWFLSSIYPLLFPRIISAVGDWMSTILPHMLWL